MADPNSTPVFIDVAGQHQFPIAQVFTHYTIQVEQSVKEEVVDQEIIQQVELVPVEPDEDEGSHVADKDDGLPVVQQCVSVVTQTAVTDIPPRPFRCTELLTNNVLCTYSTPIEDRLVRHVRKVHKGENPFQCSMCEYSTYNKAVFEEHVRVHQGIKPFKCSFCDYRSASKKNTKKHEQIHRPDNPNKCDVCNFIARHHKSLKRHKEEEHQSNGTQPPVDYDPSPAPVAAATLAAATRKHSRTVQCNRCNAKFKAIKNMNEHRKRVRNCLECGMELCNKIHEVKHMQSAHGSRGVTLFTCAICSWQTNVRPKALLHLVHHPQAVNGALDVEVLRRHRILE